MGFDTQAAFQYLDNAEVALDGLQGWLDNTFESINIYGQEGVEVVMVVVVFVKKEERRSGVERSTLLPSNCL